MQSQNSLVIFERAAIMLAEADTIQKAKELKSLALTAADWAKRKGMGEAAIQHCRSYALEAERKMGEMLASAMLEGALAKQGRPKKGNSTEPFKLDDIGISKRESSEAKRLAALPRDVFDSVLSGQKTRVEVRRDVHLSEVKEAAKLPDAKFRVLYADPPWKYGDTRNLDGWSGTASADHYPSMSIAELCAMPIKALCESDCVLFLWVTSPLLFECQPVFEAWGFTYKASFVWDKDRHNLGHYNSVQHEFLLICTRGSCIPDSKTLIDSVQTVKRTGRHSEKPEHFRELIDKLYPHGKRLELFARTKSKGWESWGNQV